MTTLQAIIGSAAAWWLLGILTVYALCRAARDHDQPPEHDTRPLAPVIELGPKQAARERRRSDGAGRVEVPAFDREFHDRVIAEFKRDGQWPA